MLENGNGNVCNPLHEIRVVLLLGVCMRAQTRIWCPSQVLRLFERLITTKKFFLSKEK